jgi:hypothetical protein
MLPLTGEATLQVESLMSLIQSNVKVLECAAIDVIRPSPVSITRWPVVTTLSTAIHCLHNDRLSVCQRSEMGLLRLSSDVTMNSD